MKIERKAQQEYFKMERIFTIPNFEYGAIWEDTVSNHRIGYLDVSKKEDVERLMQGEKAGCVKPQFLDTKFTI